VNCWDVIIAGAGIAGLSIALELRQEGASVLVLERGQPGCEASSAAAGMLAATDPDTPPALRSLSLAAASSYPEYVGKLENISGIDVDFRRRGTILFGEEAPPAGYQRLSAEALHHLEPGLQPHGHSAFLLQEDCVDPVLLMRAAVRAAHLADVEIRTGINVQNMRWAGTLVAVETGADRLVGKAAVNCLGAWSGEPVKPRKGQMMYLQPPKQLLEHVVRAPGAYIVPRSSGKILVGTTVEDTGFDKSVDAKTVQAMHTSATRYLPDLGSAAIVETWAGLRPGTPDDLPLIGPTPEQNVFVASGLFRNGILLAPVVASTVAALVLGKPISIDLTPFSPSRFTLAQT
jgi:glycine oxidase